MNLYQLVYISKATDKFSSGDLKKLLTSAKENNSSIDVTGFLIFNGGRFLQALEGDKAVIENLFKKISEDSRHESVRLIYLEPASYRVFTGWAMSMVNLDSDTPKNLSTLKSIIDAAQNNSKVDNMSAPLRLLQEFKKL